MLLYQHTLKPRVYSLQFPLLRRNLMKQSLHQFTLEDVMVLAVALFLVGLPFYLGQYGLGAATATAIFVLFFRRDIVFHRSAIKRFLAAAITPVIHILYPLGWAALLWALCGGILCLADWIHPDQWPGSLPKVAPSFLWALLLVPGVLLRYTRTIKRSSFWAYFEMR